MIHSTSYLLLDRKEVSGFRFGNQSCLRRCDRAILYRDHPILSKIRPVTRNMYSLDRVAFAADLLACGYSIGQVRRAAQVGNKKAMRLRDWMRGAGLLPERCPCGDPLGHRRWCWRRLQFRRPGRHDKQFKKKPDLTGVYWDKKSKRWRVMLRIGKSTKSYGSFVDKDAALERSRAVRQDLHIARIV